MSSHDDKQSAGLALPLSAINVSAADGWDFGWCVIDANRRVLGYCMTEAQAEQLAAPFAAPSIEASGATPRTDAAQAEEWRASERGSAIAPSLNGWDFARQLERELAVAKRWLDAELSAQPSATVPKLSIDTRMVNWPSNNAHERVVGIVIPADKFRYMHEAIDWLRSLLRPEVLPDAASSTETPQSAAIDGGAKRTDGDKRP